MREKLSLGIDEAGVGPVFGPMIISGVLIAEKDDDILRDIGVKDSKLFGSGLKAHEKRMQVSNAAEKYIKAEKQIVLEASDLDENNMYDLHIAATRKILKALDWQSADVVHIEQIGGMHRKKCFTKLGFWHSGFTYEPKSDVKYASVSLASIQAKVMRDNIICDLCEKLGEEYVSGYPNKVTEDFLRRYHKKHGQLPPETRLSRNWAPIIELT